MGYRSDGFDLFDMDVKGSHPAHDLFVYDKNQDNLDDRTWKPVEVLAYPAVAPWMKISESLEYLKAVKPAVAFPVHDAFLKFGGPYYNHPERHSKEWGIMWVVIEEGKSIEV